MLIYVDKIITNVNCIWRFRHLFNREFSHVYLNEFREFLGSSVLVSEVILRKISVLLQFHQFFLITHMFRPWYFHYHSGHLPQAICEATGQHSLPYRKIAKRDYIDGIGVYIWDTNDLEQKIRVLYQVFQERKLNVNFSKTEIIIWILTESCDITYTEPVIKLQVVKLVNTKYFRILDVWISYDKLSIGEKWT